MTAATTFVIAMTAVPTGSGKGAYPWLLPYPVGQCGVEQLDVILPHIIADPFVKNRTKEIAPLPRLYGEGRQRQIIAVGRTGEVTAVRMWHNPLDNRRKLDIMALYVLEETVELQRIIPVEIVDHGKGIPLHAIAVQEFYSPHHFGEGRFPIDTVAIAVVEALGSVDGDAYQPAVIPEKPAPLIVQQNAVGLNAIVNMPSPRIFFLEADDLPEK